MKKAHLLRCALHSVVRRTDKRTSPPSFACALHLSLFDQPANIGFSSTLACAVCFGDPKSALSKGAVAGVVTLAGVVVAVLLGISYVAFVWYLRAKKGNSLAPHSDRHSRMP